MPDGRQVGLHELTNHDGMRVSVSAYGGVVTSLTAPDRNGDWTDIVLGYEALDDYFSDHAYLGAIIGRYGNRIAGGRFTLDGDPYVLARNNGDNHLHGGNAGFDKVLWHAEARSGSDDPVLELSYSSADGEEGYPGRLDVTVTYALTKANELAITYRATSDKPTPVNLTNHSYFNLAGAGIGDILDHLVTINAEAFTPVGDGLIPTGEMRHVADTPMDFRTPTAIGARIDTGDEQLRYGSGYDHNWIVNRADNGLSLAARVFEPTTGRILEVHTSEPGVQFYTGNFLDGSVVGKGGMTYGRRRGFCLETQHYPDSPNRPEFPTAILRPGEVYQTSTVYRFRAQA